MHVAVFFGIDLPLRAWIALGALVAFYVCLVGYLLWVDGHVYRWLDLLRSPWPAPRPPAPRAAGLRSSARSRRAAALRNGAVVDAVRELRARDARLGSPNSATPEQLADEARRQSSSVADRARAAGGVSPQPFGLERWIGKDVLGSGERMQRFSQRVTRRVS